jgi:hypothetical protein
VRCVTLVPWRGGEPRREWCWDITRPSLEELGFPIFEGDSSGSWSRAGALNAASEAAGNWDIAFTADTDTIPEADAVRRAIAWVRSTGGAARPHLDRYLLTKEGTVRIARRGFAEIQPSDIDHSWPGGGLLVLTRQAWEAVGGYDESYVGWGFEDSQMTLSLLRHSSWDRLPGRAWHLWHPPARPSLETKRKAQALYAEYSAEIRAYGSNQRGMTLIKETV